MQVRDVHTETPVFKGKYLLLFNGIHHQILTGKSNFKGYWVIARSRIKRQTKDNYIFDGWYLDNGTWKKPFTIQALLDSPISNDNTFAVYAKFIKYTCDLDNKPHNFETIENEQATCTNYGHIVQRCSICGNENNKTIYPLQHNYTHAITTQPT